MSLLQKNDLDLFKEAIVRFNFIQMLLQRDRRVVFILENVDVGLKSNFDHLKMPYRYFHNPLFRYFHYRRTQGVQLLSLRAWIHTYSE